MHQGDFGCAKGDFGNSSKAISETRHKAILERHHKAIPETRHKRVCTGIALEVKLRRAGKRVFTYFTIKETRARGPEYR
jgi:hypothetical protein